MQYRLPPVQSNMSAGALSSMIDIVFLLIIFFVVTASFDQEQINSEITLPCVDSAAINSLPSQRLMINILVDGSVELGFRRISASEVPLQLPNIMHSMDADQNTVLIINGDRNAPHKFIAAVMNAATQAGYNQVRINAEVKVEK